MRARELAAFFRVFAEDIKRKGSVSNDPGHDPHAIEFAFDAIGEACDTFADLLDKHAENTGPILARSMEIKDEMRRREEQWLKHNEETMRKRNG
jgi:hypothetical protein